MTTQVQVLESGTKEDGSLEYVATEEQWSALLTTAGLTDAKRGHRMSQAEEEKAEMMNETNESNIGLSNGMGTNHGNYSVISIMGPQSSGKSTILNMLFGCKFDVMDHTRGRHQVTTGIWMGICNNASDLLIMDLEGTDALERKKNRGNFERQTSLMALTLSEVLIVNMWANDIGRATGMNVDTLKSIIQANLRLFAPNTKTRLLFLVREQSPDENQPGVTPAKILEQSIRRVIENIWNEMEKPENFSGSELSDLFDISFFFMPPLVFYRDLFNQRVKELYSRFTNSNDPNYYFNTSYHYKKSVPCEGLYTWTKQIWDSVSKDESLNIPDQQKLLATYRCEHALSEAFLLFTNKSQGMLESVSRGYVNKFGESMDVIIKESLFHYRQTANKYDSETAQMKYDELVEKIEMKVHGMFLKQLEHITNEMIGMFNIKLKKSTRHANNQSECVENLDQLVRDTAEDVRKQFSIKLDDSMISSKNQELTNKELYWSKMMDRLRDTTKSVQNEQWMILLKENEKLADEQLLWNISNILKTPNHNVWKDISTLRIDYHGRSLNGRIIKKMKNLMYPPNEIEEKIDSLRESVDALITEQIKQFVTRFDQVMQERFDKLFNKETDGGESRNMMTDDGSNNTTRGGSSLSDYNGAVFIPRDWSNPNLDVKSLYSNAKSECLTMLEFCRDIVLEGNMDLHLPEIRLKLLKSTDIQRIESSFNRFADNEFRNAEDRVRRIKMGVSGILPNNPVTWGIFLFFAWNEIWAMLTNPLYLILFLVLGGFAFIAYQAHTLGFDVKTVAFQMLQRAANTIMYHLQEFQRSHAETINAHRSSNSNLRSNLDSTSSVTRGYNSNEPTEMDNTLRNRSNH